MSKIDFQDGGCGGHLGFLSAHLAILCIINALMLIIKFGVNCIIEEMSKI